MSHTDNLNTNNPVNEREQVPVQPGYPAPGNYPPGYYAYPYAPYYYYQYPQGYPSPQQTAVPSEPPQMYSPNLFADMPLPRKTDQDAADTVKSDKNNDSGVISFFKSVCLIIVCVTASAIASFAVTDYRFENGDFTPSTTLVTLGATPSGGTETTAADSGSSTPATYTPEGEMSAEDIYERAITQVVGVNTTDNRSLFDSFSTASSGSGFVISTDGYILTNYHVIEMARMLDMPITVVMHDSSSYDAEIIGFDAGSDVAVIKIDAADLTPIYIGDSDAMRVGQKVYAVGNPFGDLVYTMTEGIVSALDRAVTVEGRTINTFQFSAAVNSGNSGGPVYNTRGEVVGIVTAKVIRGNVEGIGFAIPIKDAVDIAASLIEHGYISGRPLLGITVQTVSRAQAEYLEAVVGVYVRSVTPGSAAENAGMKVGDIITAVADTPIETLEELSYTLRDWKAGDTTIITVWREGEPVELTITFDEDRNAGRPEGPPPVPDSPDPFENMP